MDAPNTGARPAARLSGGLYRCGPAKARRARGSCAPMAPSCEPWHHRAAMASVSYVVTVYNKAPALSFLIAGLDAQQGDFEREFIFVDDGSTDGSLSVLRALTTGWRDVTIVEQANAGPAPALNLGLRRARGDYIKPMDADDLLLPWATR